MTIKTRLNRLEEDAAPPDEMKTVIVRWANAQDIATLTYAPRKNRSAGK